jgi:hypothetical protein
MATRRGGKRCGGIDVPQELNRIFMVWDERKRGSTPIVGQSLQAYDLNRKLRRIVEGIIGQVSLHESIVYQCCMLPPLPVPISPQRDNWGLRMQSRVLVP